MSSWLIQVFRSRDGKYCKEINVLVKLQTEDRKESRILSKEFYTYFNSFICKSTLFRRPRFVEHILIYNSRQNNSDCDLHEIVAVMLPELS